MLFPPLYQIQRTVDRVAEWAETAGSDEPIQRRQSLAVGDPIVAQDRLGLESLESIVRDLDKETDAGGGVVPGTLSEDKLAAEIANTIGNICRSIGMRTPSPGVGERKRRATEKFLRAASRAHTKSPEDT